MALVVQTQRGKLNTLYDTTTVAGEVGYTLTFPAGMWQVVDVTIRQQGNNVSRDETGYINVNDVSGNIITALDFNYKGGNANNFLSKFHPQDEIILGTGDFMYYTNVDQSSSGSTVYSFYIRALLLR